MYLSLVGWLLVWLNNGNTYKNKQTDIFPYDWLGQIYKKRQLKK
jgi:hypothetical protein